MVQQVRRRGRYRRQNINLNFNNTTTKQVEILFNRRQS